MRRMVGALGSAVVIAAVVVGAGTAHAQEAGGTVTVAVRVLEPFVIQEPDGDLSGFSVDLAREIADEAGFEPEFVVVENVGAQLDAVRTGTADAAIGAISITAEREEVLDFSQPMFDSGIQVATSDRAGGTSITALARQVFTPLLLGILAIVVAGILMAGLVAASCPWSGCSSACCWWPRSPPRSPPT